MWIKCRMHPKNIYKDPPDLKDLAIHFPDFRQYVKQDLSGKVTIDYQDKNAVKELTRTLLKKDFDLEVEIDETRLIPRVPLCLNYVLWIEDLLEFAQLENPHGIDIGTGSVGIYSILAAKKGWKMLATEVDPYNYKKAEENVSRNKLDNKISVKLVSDSKQILVDVIDKETKYDFCMCNPPFFDINEKPQNRTSRRPQLESVASEVTTEISCEGGEVSFIKNLIEESVVLKDQIKIFTTLVGKKSDFVFIKKELLNILPKSVAFTEFGQGRTIRWGIAWTFGDYNLLKVKWGKKSKRKPPLQFVIPESKPENINSVFEETKKVLNDLKIHFQDETCGPALVLSCKAYENTWSHQRRKNRLKARMNEQNLEESGSTPVDLEVDEDCPQSKKVKLDEDCPEIKKVKLDEDCPESKKVKLDEEAVSVPVCDDKPLIVEGLLFLKNVDSSVTLELSYIGGDKGSIHQIFQYLKNHFNRNDDLQ